MTKNIYKNNIPFRIDENRKGAKATINGVDFMNWGQLKQILLVSALFGKIEKPDHVPYNEGSDIPELNASVKSAKGGLTDIYLGTTKEEILKAYFKTTASTCWIWVTLEDDNLTAYTMNKTEFLEFNEKFGAVYSKKIRYPRDTAALIRWLEEQAA